MKKLLLLFLTILTINFSAFAQEKNTKHIVTKGETIIQIAKKYKVATSDIYRLNPDAQVGLKPNMVLIIPANTMLNPVKNQTEKSIKIQTKTHTVAPKETIYGLAKMYNVSVADLENANPAIEVEGLKIGSIITIPAQEKGIKKELKTENKLNKKNQEIKYHVVLAKETKYSIAKIYGISIEDLDVANPETLSGLQIGYRLKIIASEFHKATLPDISEKKQERIILPEPVKKHDFMQYEVKSKETLYSLTKKFNLSQDELIKLNPALKDGVNEGMFLQLPVNVSIAEEAIKSYTDLSKSINTNIKKKLVLLLPFNISKIESDTVNSTASRLKTDKFLNMTLDFYSGALMAIDSAKTLGLNIDVKIYDSQETRTSSNVASIIQQNNLQTADVVIGPFYQTNVEKTAEILLKNRVPVISPLSKEVGKSYENLLLATPSSEAIKNAMFDYMRAKNGNIVAIIDPKKLGTKQFITQYHKDVKFVPMNEKATFLADSVVIKLVKNKMNYVVLDSEKTGMILKTTNILIGLMATYQIQLVILEKNETLDFEEIPLSKLAKLKMLYPSLTKDNETPEGSIFEKEYRAINKIIPNQFASRGFDITFDTLLRLSQEKSFMETIQSGASEQIESKFDYQNIDSGAFSNNGIYILYYDTDLSVKEAQ